VYEIPLASQGLGYMLMGVSPGIVFISLTTILLLVVRKKSTRDSTSQDNVLKVSTANC
jgi:hypothetical protein